MPHTSRVSPCYAYRYKGDEESEEAYARRLADELEAEIVRVGEDKVAAFFAETGRNHIDQMNCADTLQSVERPLAILLPCQAISRVSDKFATSMVCCWSWMRLCAGWDELAKCTHGSGRVSLANRPCEISTLTVRRGSRHSDNRERAERRLPSSLGSPYPAKSH